MSKLRPLEYLFSITNSGAYKKVMVLGIPFKFDRTKSNRKFCASLPVQKNKIIFMNYLGNPYGCNPKYIVEEILKRKLPVDMVWICKRLDEDFIKSFPKEMRFVKYKSKECMKEMASARFWISNYHFVKLLSLGVDKKDDQYYIQTWHGSLGIKKIEKNVKSLTEDEKWTEFAQLNSRNVDCWVSNSKFETDIYKEAFWDVKNIQEYGHPRNDIFFKSDMEKEIIKTKVHSELDIPVDKKFLLYVPSFRDGEDLSCYELDIETLKNTLNKKFGGDWVIVSRMHPHFKRRNLEKLNFVGNVVEANNYPDIQELLLAADAAITDYSSCIFDFMLGRKPAFIFATDIKDYNTERGFYYPLETTPFQIAVNNSELCENIMNFDNENYQRKIDDFLQEKGCIEDGHASERVVDLVEKILTGENKCQI